MATKSWPYVSIDGDRKTTAADEAKGYDMFVGSGVVPGMGGELTVTKVPDTMSVSIANGNAIISGHRYVQDEAITLNLETGSAQPRIDIVALESNANTPVREVRFVVVKGTPATSPQPPSLTSDAAIQQQEYARLVIPAGAANLNSATLTDNRVYASGRHIHSVADIAYLQGLLDGKAAASHNHSISNVTNLQSTLDGKAAASHNHSISNVTNLQSTLDGKSATGHKHAAQDITGGILDLPRGGTGANNSTQARVNLGAQKTINFGTEHPVVGSHGDIYIKYE
jgi:hypothetical protein